MVLGREKHSKNKTSQLFSRNCYSNLVIIALQSHIHMVLHFYKKWSGTCPCHGPTIGLIENIWLSRDWQITSRTKNKTFLMKQSARVRVSFICLSIHLAWGNILSVFWFSLTFYLYQKEWVWHKTRWCPLQQSSILIPGYCYSSLW